MQLKWTERIPLTQSGINRIKAIAGVYRLINHNQADDRYCVYYVGQADDLKNRLAQHLSGHEVNNYCQKYLDNYVCYFRAAAISGQADRDGAEVALYNKFEPSCVERIPNVKPIEINFE